MLKPKNHKTKKPKTKFLFLKTIGFSILANLRGVPIAYPIFRQ